MIPRLVVPINARISSKQITGPLGVRQDLLVPRSLIPANARISEAVEANGSRAQPGKRSKLHDA